MKKLSTRVTDFIFIYSVLSFHSSFSQSQITKLKKHPWMFYFEFVVFLSSIVGVFCHDLWIPPFLQTEIRCSMPNPGKNLFKAFVSTYKPTLDTYHIYFEFVVFLSLPFVASF